MQESMWPGEQPPAPPTTVAEPQVSRLFALVQVILVCGIPTQLLVFAVLLGAGSPMSAEGTMVTDATKISLEFFAMTSLFDTALVAILIRIFIAFSKETSRDVFVGHRRPLGEIVRGLLLIPVCLIGVSIVVNLITMWIPSLHNVPKNPYEAYMQTPLRAGVFIVVVILAGGVREELQRAFVLHRFEQRLGGARLGLVIWSTFFGMLHLPQGIDAALAVGVLGVVWGYVYIRRRSAIAPMVSHAGFDAAEILAKAAFGQ